MSTHQERLDALRSKVQKYEEKTHVSGDPILKDLRRLSVKLKAQEAPLYLKLAETIDDVIRATLRARTAAIPASKPADAEAELFP